MHQEGLVFVGSDGIQPRVFDLCEMISEPTSYGKLITGRGGDVRGTIGQPWHVLYQARESEGLMCTSHVSPVLY